MTQTAQKIEAIFDLDHGDKYEGWYARVTRTDGQRRDLPFDARRSCGDKTLATKARRAARDDGFRVPRNCEMSICR